MSCHIEAGREGKMEKKVAIVGSGMAGLVTAYLLNQDEKRRYVVTLFEEVCHFQSCF
jgi:predicted NAD/FAD-binding protein